MQKPETVEGWEEVIGAALAARPSRVVNRVVVMAEAASTQDECRARCGGRAGLLVTAIRQAAGRGRLGRRWVDEAGEGVAMTVATARPENAARLSIGAAMAVCLAVERLGLGEGLAGVRWPNDVMAGGRKLAGILVEADGAMAMVGIGVNVLQREWPTEIANVAASLAQLGVNADRASVVLEFVRGLDETLVWDDVRLAEEFGRRDCLKGTVQAFKANGRVVRGKVTRVDPLRGIDVKTAEGVMHLPAATTTRIRDDDGGDEGSGATRCR